MVQKGVMAELQPLIDSIDVDEHTNALLRKASLERWLKSNNPLTYTEDVLTHLVHAICPADRIPPELTYASIGKQSISWFSFLLYDIASNPDARRKPPFIEGGSFRSVLAIAITESRSAALKAGMDALPTIALIKEALEFVSSSLKIAQTPWSPNAVQGHRPSTSIVHHTWLAITPRSAPPPSFSNRTLGPNGASQMLAYRTAQAMVQTDPHGPWSLLRHPLSDFASILHKRCAPEELSLSHAHFDRTAAQVTAAYEATIAAYDADKPIHQISLFCACVLANMAPNVFIPKENDRDKPPQNSKALKNYIRNLGWVSRESRKGTVDRPSYITCGTVFFISVLDETCSVYQKWKKDAGFKKTWFTKHSEHFHLLINTAFIASLQATKH